MKILRPLATTLFFPSFAIVTGAQTTPYGNGNNVDYISPAELLEGCLDIDSTTSACPIESDTLTSTSSHSSSSNPNNAEPQHPSCYKITGFSDRDFHANGLYCTILEETVTTSADTTSKSTKEKPVAASDSSYLDYQLIAVPDELRYELRRFNEERWDIIRVVKSRRNVWIGFPIYAGFVRSEDSNGKSASNSTSSGPSSSSNEVAVGPENLEWMGLSLDHMNDGKYTKIDYTEPPLDVSRANNIHPSYLKSIHALHLFRSSEIDECVLSICDGYYDFPNSLPPQQIDPHCIDYWKVAAQLAESTGNYLESAHRLQNARSCATNQIHDLASKLIPIPRLLRWEVAELSHLMTKSLVLAGYLGRALDATLMGLANSPEKKQRRRLYGDLGDLRLAMGEVEGSWTAYVKSLDAVREKASGVERQLFLQYFENSVGDFIGQVSRDFADETSIGSSNDVKNSLRGRWAIPPNYSEARLRMLLAVERMRVSEVNLADSLDLNMTTSSYFLPNLNNVCKMDESDGVLIQSNRSEFCNSYTLRQ